MKNVEKILRLWKTFERNARNMEGKEQEIKLVTLQL